MIIHSLFAEVVNRAPGLILGNVNYVKRVVFPLEILPIISMGDALFNSLTSLIVLLIALLLFNGYLHWMAIFIPLVMMPPEHCIMTQKTNKHIIVVLGMHRSGTSAITKSLELLGVGLGSELYPANIDNPTGFWEDKVCIEINEKLLNHLGSAYNRLDLAWDRIKADSLISELRLRATQYISHRLVENKGIWGFKDPRTCRLLNFWHDVFLALECEVSFVIAVRNPASVTASLAARDNIPPEKAYFLWLQHILPPLSFMRNSRRIVVDYDKLLENPYSQITRISDKLGLPIPDHQNPLVRDFENSFLEKNLDIHTLHLRSFS